MNLHLGFVYFNEMEFAAVAYKIKRIRADHLQGLDSLIDALGRPIVDNMKNLREWTGGSGEGICFLSPKMFRWRLEARNFRILGRG